MDAGGADATGRRYSSGIEGTAGRSYGSEYDGSGELVTCEMVDWASKKSLLASSSSSAGPTAS